MADDLKLSILKNTFGHDGFRDGQEAVIDILLADRSALALFPTGAGKSLCYQLPALALEGLTLVVSPLIALMKDQVESLQSKGIPAARLDSTLDLADVNQIHDSMISGELRLLYVAPERLGNDGFLRRLRRCHLSLLAVDEAHCISEWGHNFRPDYLKVADVADDLGIARRLALTATATPAVASQIRERFGIASADHIQTSFHRPNLSFLVHPCDTEARDRNLLTRIKDRIGASIVYVTMQRTAEEVAGRLKQAGVDARAYHAGMRDDHRAEVQDQFMRGEVEVVVATIAFGMGVDKSDIRHVYHYNLPKSLENYVQESGRAGRDGEAATCEIFACADDLTVLENFIYGDTPSPAALKSLVEAVLLRGDDFSISRYDLSQSKDIRPTVVSTALTYLELDGTLEPLGPFYGGYRVQLLQSREQVLAGHTEDRRRFLDRLFQSADEGRIWLSIDVARSAMELDEPEDRIRKALRYLEEMGDAIVKPSHLRHRYRLPPDGSRVVSEVAGRLIERFETREQNEIDRLHQVIGHCESQTCLTQGVLHYFGEEGDSCGHCGICRGQYTGGPLLASERKSITFEDAELIRELHAQSHIALRQPRQFTRFLCGLSSPATTRAKLHRHDAFGRLAAVPFGEVLTHVETL
ncbi:MAG: ATP-dependent DNA helicase RecQ [Verrucomicrobiota bacterium]